MVLVMSLEWLGKFGDPCVPMKVERCRGDFVLAAAEDDASNASLRWREGAAMPRRIRRGVVAESDVHARTYLASTGCSHGVLPDGGDPARLWRLAGELGHVPWLADEEAASVRAEVALRLAQAVGAVHPAADTPLLEALRAAARIALGDDITDGFQARAAGLWPHVLLRPDGSPLGVGRTSRSGLPRGGGAVFRLAAERLRVESPPGLRPAPRPRPVLSSVPHASDPQEAEEVSRHAGLAGDVSMVPAAEPEAVRASVVARFPWMADAAGVVARELALLSEAAPCVVPPLLFLGPPGCGKTTFARVVASACGLPSRVVHATDANGSTTLAGNGRGWRSGRPALPITAMSEAGVSTVALIVDDIDRQATDDRYGTPQEWLLSVMEPSTARAFEDPFLQVACDLSTVSWLLTANDASAVVGALLDRVAVVEVAYPPADAAELVLDAVMREVEHDAGWGPGSMRLPPSVREALLRAFVSDSSTLRLLRRAVRASVGAARLGEDALAAARRELAGARRRDDRGYGGSTVGFGRSRAEPV